MVAGVDIFSLSGKTVLLTGATGYLGTAMSRILCEAGACLYVNGRNPDRVESLVSSLRALGYSAQQAIFDVQNSDEVSAFTHGFSGRALDVLINNAYAGNGGTIEGSEPSMFRESFESTVIASQRLFCQLLPSMRIAAKKNGDASVINLATMYALISPDLRIYEDALSANPPFYGAAKAALIQWTRYAACEFGSEGIRFNAISPGPFPERISQREQPEFIRKLQEKVPLGRIGSPDEMKGPILFLASSASSYVTGANLVVDGGWTCW